MYSLINNYIPANMISTANSVLMTGCYLGIGFSCLSVNLVKALGWRESFSIIGFFGVIIGILSLIVLREPERKETKPVIVLEDNYDNNEIKPQ